VQVELVAHRAYLVTQVLVVRLVLADIQAQAVHRACPVTRVRVVRQAFQVRADIQE
jgi:hypothetical protein